MPKKGGGKVGGAAERRMAVIPDLYAIYSTYLSEGVIDMIAKQCNYDLDLCISTLAEMVHDAAPHQQEKAHTSQASSSFAASASSSNTLTPTTASTPAPAPAAESKPVKKGILFLSPRPSSDLLKKQPPSVWKKQQQATPQPAAKQPWAPTALSSASVPAPAQRRPVATSAPAVAAYVDGEAGYGSDANDEPLVRPSGYIYTGFESQPYFDLQPSLLDSIPQPVRVPVADVVLDPHTPSAARWRKVADRDGVSAASPAHPAHHLHALYLQLQNGESNEPAQPKFGGSMFTAPLQAPAAAEALPAENLTPSQARAFQAQAHHQSLQQKKQQATWMKRHEQEKKNVRAQAFSSALPNGQADEIDAPVEFAGEEPTEADLSAMETLAPQDSLADIPSLAPLSRIESQASYERLRSRPHELEQLLIDLFAGEVEEAIVRAIVESVLATPVDNADQRDVAQECCDTLLAMVAENDFEAQRRLDQLAPPREVTKPSSSGPTKKKGSSSSSASLMNTPFVPSSHQLTDAELAWRLSVDPDFDPDALAPLDANVGLTPAASSSIAAAPLQRNKRGHVLLPRGGLNAWASQSTAVAAVAPDLSSQWKLAALARAFPSVESEAIDMAFRANSFQFEQTKAHLRAMYPHAVVNEQARPAPVAQPWSQSSVHHSKVTSTSRTEAERGPKDGNWDASGASSSGDDDLTDEQLEAELGSVLDNRSSGPQSGVDLRAQANVHARRRAAFFSAAIGAFTRGHGSMASDYASKGKEAARALAHTAARAGLEVFVANNSGQDCTRAVDLHGLHVSEAVRILDFILRRRSASSVRQAELSLITGVGHHSAGGVRGARLAPAVSDYLKRAGYSFSTAREGEIRVFFR